MEENIINLITKLFIKKDCNLSSLDVIAALVTAATAIAHCSSIATPSEVEETILQIFSASDNVQINELLGMEYTTVNALIGYDVNFRDVDEALKEFEKNKDSYEFLFSTIKEKIISSKPSI